MKDYKISRIILSVFGWLMIVVAILLAVLGTVYGIVESDGFYERQDKYYALEDSRDSIRAELDSLYNICIAENPDYDDVIYDVIYGDEDYVMAEDSLPCPVQEQIDSIKNTEKYQNLFSTPAPPVGFSLAGLVSVMIYIFCLIPLGIGIILLLIRKRLKKKAEE